MTKHRYNRRQALTLAGAVTASIATPAIARSRAKVGIIGGGIGGAAAADFLLRHAPHLDIYVFEPNLLYTACPLSNLVLIGARQIESQQFSYDTLIRRGVTHIRANVKTIADNTKTLTYETNTGEAQQFVCDYILVSPGIDMNWQAIEGYNEAANLHVPHAWKAGPQTLQLRQSILNMRDGGVFILSVPPAPFRCPPGPYERATLAAHFFKSHNPRAKILILDGQERFSKQALFEDLWARDYADMIERVPLSQSGQVISFDPSAMSVMTDFDTHSGDVINIIPPQMAGRIAQHSGLTDATRWCPVDTRSFMSQERPGIYVLGDATIAAPMPKSAFAASLQAKLAALHILHTMGADQDIAPKLANVCYSFTSPDTAISISGVYEHTQDGLSAISGTTGMSPMDANFALRQDEARQAQDWFDTLTTHIFG